MRALVRVHVFVYVSRIKVSKMSREKNAVHSFHFISIHSFIHSFNAFFVVQCWNVDETPNNLYPAEIPRNFIALVNQIVQLNSSFNKSLCLYLSISLPCSLFWFHIHFILVLSTNAMTWCWRRRQRNSQRSRISRFLPRSQPNNELQSWAKKRRERKMRDREEESERNGRERLACAIASDHMFFKRPLTAYSNHLMNDDIVTAFCILLQCKRSFGVFILWIDGNVPTHFRASIAHICVFFRMAFHSLLLVSLVPFRSSIWTISLIEQFHQASRFSTFSLSFYREKLFLLQWMMTHSFAISFCWRLPFITQFNSKL